MALWTGIALLSLLLMNIPTVVLQKDAICPPVLDIAILIDTSGGLDSVFEQQTNWTIGIIKELPVHEDAVRISLVLYAEEAQTEFNLSRYSERNDIINHLENMKLPSGDTKSGNALLQAETELFDFDNGARYNSNRIVIIFTDGLSMDNPTKVAKVLRKRGVKIFSISVNSIGFVPEMLGIVGDSDNIYGPLDEERLQERLLGEVEKSRSCEIQPKKNGKTTSAFTTRFTEAPFNGPNGIEEIDDPKVASEMFDLDQKSETVDPEHAIIVSADELSEISGTTTSSSFSSVESSLELPAEENIRGSSLKTNINVLTPVNTVGKTPVIREENSHLLNNLGQINVPETSKAPSLLPTVETITTSSPSIDHITVSTKSSLTENITSTVPTTICTTTSTTTSAPTLPVATTTTPAEPSTKSILFGSSTIAFSTSPLPLSAATTATSFSRRTTTSSPISKRTPSVVSSTTITTPSPLTLRTTTPAFLQTSRTKSAVTFRPFTRSTTAASSSAVITQSSLQTTRRRFFTNNFSRSEKSSIAPFNFRSLSTTTSLPPTTSSTRLSSTRKWTPTRGPNTLVPATTIFPTLLNMEKAVTLPIQKSSDLKQRKKIKRIIKRRRNILTSNELEKIPGNVIEIKQTTPSIIRKFSRNTFKPVVTEEETEIVKNVVQCPMDILFVVDSSGSIAKNYDAQKDFLTSLVKKVEPSRGHRVGLIQFAGPHLQKMEWSFDAHSKNSQLLSAIRSVRHLTGTTYIGAALELSLILLDSRRKHTETTVLLVSDGFSQDDSTQQAKLLRQLPNVKMYAISLNNLTNTQYLTDIVGQRENLFVNDESQWFEEFFTKKLRCVPSTR